MKQQGQTIKSALVLLLIPLMLSLFSCTEKNIYDIDNQTKTFSLYLLYLNQYCDIKQIHLLLTF
jgi:hypothetical protein